MKIVTFFLQFFVNLTLLVLLRPKLLDTLFVT